LSGKGGAIVIEPPETQTGNAKVGVHVDLVIVACVAGDRDITVARVNARAIIIFRRGKDGHLAIQTCDPATNPCLAYIRVRVRRVSVTNLELSALKQRTVIVCVIPHDKIDHTCDCVRAVNR
jgi:hypothetical protein